MQRSLFNDRRGCDFGAEGFFLRLNVLLFQDFFLCPFGAAALLTSDLLGPLFFGADPAGLNALNPVQKQPPGEKAVQGLGALLLAFDGKPRGGVDEIDAGGGFIDFLAAGAGRTDKGFLEIVFGDAQVLHPDLKGGFFFGRDVE
jgi:hypothetical protein